MQPTPMTGPEIRAFREKAGLTQLELSIMLGLTSRALVDIENSKTMPRLLHSRAIERIGLQRAIEMRDPMIAPASVRRDALKFAELISSG